MLNLLLSPYAKYAAIIAAIGATMLWLRWDAVQDYRAELEAKRVEGIEDARTIENDTGDADDAALLEWLRSIGG